MAAECGMRKKCHVLKKHKYMIKVGVRKSLERKLYAKTCNFEQCYEKTNLLLK